ncbi:MAG: GHKL domain-containing protein, partial [Clostridiales bacterium]|nr:GHKL domain-containing protein [Candidatus Blautia equi]
IVVELTEVPLGYSLIVQNAIDTSVLDSNPELNTTKSDAGLHGFGLKSVKQLIEKRNGLLEIYEDNHFFTVHVLY